MRQNISECAVRSITCQTFVTQSGRVTGVAGNIIHVHGLSDESCCGDRITISAKTGALNGEIVRLTASEAIVLVPQGAGVAIGDRVRSHGAQFFAPADHWIGRVIDPDGRPLDGRPLLQGIDSYDINTAPPLANQRRSLGARLETGYAVFNTILPIVQGQRVGLFAGSGVGKSTLLAGLARGIEADVIVMALVGERGREVQHFVQDVLGSKGMERSVVVAATSDQPAQVRRRCAASAMSVAEFFRDQGKQVLLLVDSVTRFCEAHRELAVAGGEQANLRGYPASTGPAIASLCERAGPGCDGQGDITAVFSVLVAGSDMDEPVADMLRGVLDGHIVLSREIAERGRFPAVDILRSVSRALPDAANEMENGLINTARRLFSAHDRSDLMIKAGLYEAGKDQDTDQAVACFAALDSFVSIQDTRMTITHFAKLRQAMAPTGAVQR